MKRYSVIGAALIALAANVSAQQSEYPAGTQQQQRPQTQTGAVDQALPSGFETKSLIKSGQTRDHEPIVYPKTEKPEIITVIGTLQQGGRTALHEHPVPVIVYVLEGEIELQTEGGESHQYKTGDAYIESVNRRHQAINKGNAPARVLVVFVGEEGKPTTVTAK